MKAMEFEEHDHRTGLIFVDHGMARVSYHTHRLVYDIDLSKFKQIRPTFASHLMAMENYSDGPESEAILESLTEKLYEMENYEIVIEHFKSMDIFEIIPKYENIKINFDNIVLNQLSLLDRSNESRRPITDEVIQTGDRPSFDDIENQINQLKSRHEMDQSMMIQKISKLLQTMATEHNRIAEQIIAVFKCQDVNQLVEISTLLNQLKFVDENPLKNHEQLPNDFIEMNPYEIYQITTIKTPIYNKNNDSRLLIEIEFPVIDSENFSILQILPVPINVNQFSVILIPTMQYVLVNDYDFIPITDDDYFNRKLNYYGETIIKPTKSKYTNCEMSILLKPKRNLISQYCDYKVIPTGNYIVPINSNDLFYVSVTESMNDGLLAEERCSDGIKRHQMFVNSGMLRLSKDCHLHIGDRIDLTSRNNDEPDAIKFKAVTEVADANAIAIINDKISALNDKDIPKATKIILINHTNANEYKELIREVHSYRIEKIKLNETNENYNSIYQYMMRLHANSVFFFMIFVIVVVKIIDRLVFSISLAQKHENFDRKHEDLFLKINPTALYPKLVPSAPLQSDFTVV